MSAAAEDWQSALQEACRRLTLSRDYDATRLQYLRDALAALDTHPTLPSDASVRLFTGDVMAVDLRDLVARDLFVYRMFEPELSWFLMHAAKPGMIVYDVGAHFGYYTRIMSAAMQHIGAIHAFEPSARTARYLQQNLGPIGTLVAAAVSDQEGVLTINDYGPRFAAFNSVAGARLPAGHAATPEPFEVPCMTLDAYARTHGAPDLVKIDTESSEGAVIAGMSELLQTKRPIVTIEVGDFDELIAAGVPTSASVLKRIQSYNYRLFEFRSRSLAPHAIAAAYEYSNIVAIPAERDPPHLGPE